MTPHDEYSAIADLYDSVPLYKERLDIAFYVEAARESGGPVLELGCGTGRVLVPTARAGIDITGLDSSSGMLDVCRTRLAHENETTRRHATLVEDNLTTFELGKTFALITIPFRPFQHLLTVNDQIAALERVHRHLSPNGRFIFDLFNPSIDALATLPAPEEKDDGPAFTTPDGRRVQRKSRILKADRFAQVNDIELIYYVTHPGGRAERLVHAFQMRYVFRFEMEHLLARCGFRVERLYGGFDRSEYGATYPGELIFVASRA